VPEDWSNYTYIAFEWRSTTPQPFSLQFFSKDGSNGAEMVASRTIEPYENVWTWVLLPLDYFRKPVLPPLAHNQRPGEQYFVDTDHGDVAPVKLVTAIGFRMDHPLGQQAPTLELRHFNLGKESTTSTPPLESAGPTIGGQTLPGAPATFQPRTVNTSTAFRAILDSKVIDNYGQWRPGEWPGKIWTDEKLRAAWNDEEKKLATHDFGYDIYGGQRNTQATASGFFRVEQINGKWWFIDPDGRLFYAAGVSGRAGSANLIKRADFDRLPRLVSGAPGGSDATFNSSNTAFYEGNYITRHDPDHISYNFMKQGHDNLTLRRLDAWGINIVDQPLVSSSGRKIPYIQRVDFWPIRNTPREHIMGLQDVYSPDFVKCAESIATQACTDQRKADPYLLGYLIDIGPAWINHETMFVYDAFDRYLAVMVAAIRRHDPHHLILGLAFQQADLPEAFFRFSKYIDVLSMNLYGEAPDPRFIARLHTLSGKPLLITAFSFGAPGRGLGGGPAAVADQTQRAKAYRYYAEHAAALPTVLGTLWCQWVDESAIGQTANTFTMRPISGENYNLGLVDVTDRPYDELTAALTATHKTLANIHAGKTLPTNDRALHVVLDADFPGAAK
jgi:hypothetical protein